MTDPTTLKAMNEDANLIIIRERYVFLFWVALSTGIGAFAIYKLSSSNK